jgi:hypothetical protein
MIVCYLANVGKDLKGCGLGLIKVVSRHLHGWAEEIHENPQPAQI